MGMQQDQPEDSAGIVFTQDAGQSPREVPGDGDGPPARTPPPKVAAPSEGPVTVAMSAAIVKFPILTVSHAVAEVTSYPGFNFTIEEAEALANAIAELGYQVPPWMNAMLLGIGIVAGKTIAYAVWKRRGGDTGNPDHQPSEAMDSPPENPYAEHAQQ